MWALTLLCAGLHCSLLPPVDYRSLVYLMKRCRIILTDSGGIQEEAPTLHKPVLVLREVTERPEAVAVGTSQVIGTEPRSIVESVSRLLDDSCLYERMTSVENPFGDGHAAERIVQTLERAAGCESMYESIWRVARAR